MRRAARASGDRASAEVSRASAVVCRVMIVVPPRWSGRHVGRSLSSFVLRPPGPRRRKCLSCLLRGALDRSEPVLGAGVGLGCGPWLWALAVGLGCGPWLWALAVGLGCGPWLWALAGIRPSRTGQDRGQAGGGELL